MTALIAGIPTILGIIGVVVAWKFNPRRQLYADADALFINWEKLNVIRDKALSTNDSDSLTVVTAQLIELRKRKTEILQRLTDTKL